MRYDRLKDLRVDKDVKQRVIAEYLGICRSTYSNYENGDRGIPTDILIKIAEYHDVSMDYLVGRTDDKKLHK